MVLRAKFGVSSFVRYGDVEGFPTIPRDPGHALLTQFYIFCLVPLRIVSRAKFGVSSSVRYGDIEGVPKFKK